MHMSERDLFLSVKRPRYLVGCSHAAQEEGQNLNSFVCLPVKLVLCSSRDKLVRDLAQSIFCQFVLTHSAELQNNRDGRSLSFSPFSNFLVGGNEDDTNGLVTHITRKTKMEVDSGRYRQTRLASTRVVSFSP